MRSRTDEKWLNVMLDLNGILCVCEDWKSNRSTKQYNNSSAPHLATIGAIVGMKAVYVCPNCLSSLEELGKIASISVWSSMKIWNVEGVVNYLFLKGKLPCLVEKKVKVVVGNSASSLYAKEQKAAMMSVSDVVRLMRRRVYEDANYGTIRTEVPATGLTDRQDLGGHAASSTSSGR